MITYIKKDIARVREFLMMLSNGRLPEWVIYLFYILVMPLANVILIPCIMLVTLIGNVLVYVFTKTNASNRNY